MCATLYIYTRFRFSLLGNVPSVFDPLKPAGTIVPFTIGWRCHFQTIAHDPPSVPFLFYTCMHVDQPGDTLLARVYLYNFVLSVCVACYSLISSSVHVESRSNLQHVRQWCVFFQSRNTKLEGQWRKLPSTEYTCRRNTREIREILSYLFYKNVRIYTCSTAGIKHG